MRIIKILAVNLITAARGASIFLFGYLLTKYYLLTLLCAALFTATDCVDGWLARKWNATTKFGAIFDPLVDKIFYFGGLWFLTPLVPALSEIARQTLWPEFLLMVIRIPPFPQWLHIQTPATQYGKIKMACQSFVLIYIILGLFLNRPDIITSGVFLAYACVFLSLLSLLSHFDDPFKAA